MGFFSSTKLGHAEFNIAKVPDGVVLEKIKDSTSPKHEGGGDGSDDDEDRKPFTEDFMKIFGLCANMNKLKEQVDVSQKIQSLENVIYVSLLLNTSLWIMSGMIFYAAHL